MSKLNSHRITEKDVDNAWTLLASYFLGDEEWTQQHELACVITDGGTHLHSVNGQWPTIGEALAYREAKQR
jgi:hypothetical protein